MYYLMPPANAKFPVYPKESHSLGDRLAQNVSLCGHLWLRDQLTDLSEAVFPFSETSKENAVKLS